MPRFPAALIRALSAFSFMTLSLSAAEITVAEASHFAGLALKGIGKEFPNKMDHVMNSAADVRGPRELHPAFYGCFDWHSSVHGHWMLVHLLRLHPSLPEAPAIRAALRANLTRENLAVETAYLKKPGTGSFERTYGWAWLLKLAAELHGWEDADGREWAAWLAPLAEAFVERYLNFLPRQTYPIRTGVHANTAFGLSFALDYARVAGHRELETLIVSRAKEYFGHDIHYPASWEPGGEDFLSPALMEAALMRRVLTPEEFTVWWGKFLPVLPPALLTPAVVSDRGDPKIVHLDGLNLSRAACLWELSTVFPEGDARRSQLSEAAARHASSSLPHVASGDYAGEHWLASFAVWMLSSPGAVRPR